MLQLLKKFTSRKFLVSLLVILSGLGMMFVELNVSQVVEIVAKVSGAILALGSVLGYTLAEASIDKANVYMKDNDNG